MWNRCHIHFHGSTDPPPLLHHQTLPVYRQYKASLNIPLVQSLATFNISVKFRAMYSVICYFCGLNLTLIINYSLDLPFVWFIHKFLCFISVVMFTLILDPVLNFVKTPPAHGFSHISWVLSITPWCTLSYKKIKKKTDRRQYLYFTNFMVTKIKFCNFHILRSLVVFTVTSVVLTNTSLL